MVHTHTQRERERERETVNTQEYIKGLWKCGSVIQPVMLVCLIKEKTKTEGEWNAKLCQNIKGDNTIPTPPSVCNSCLYFMCVFLIGDMWFYREVTTRYDTSKRSTKQHHSARNRTTYGVVQYFEFLCSFVQCCACRSVLYAASHRQHDTEYTARTQHNNKQLSITQFYYERQGTPTARHRTTAHDNTQLCTTPNDTTRHFAIPHYTARFSKTPHDSACTRGRIVRK